MMEIALHFPFIIIETKKKEFYVLPIYPYPIFPYVSPISDKKYPIFIQQPISKIRMIYVDEPNDYSNENDLLIHAYSDKTFNKTTTVQWRDDTIHQ